MSNPIHQATRKQWDDRAPQWEEHGDRRGLWQRCAAEPGLALSPQELDFLSEITGKQVCVLGSGDNEVAFALAGLDAAVTSVDISEGQLAVARKRAARLNLPITFLQADVTDLSNLPNDKFDLVYTGGHVAVWVSNIERFCREGVRILKPAGLFMVNEYHPFRRPWRDSPDGLKLACGYFNRGPHEYVLEDEAGIPEPDAPLQREFHWTVSDYVMAVLSAGCDLLLLDEFGEEAEDWECAPLAGLPRSLLIVSRKRAPGSERQYPAPTTQSLLKVSDTPSL